jgi:hypothetical protein
MSARLSRRVRVRGDRAGDRLESHAAAMTS